ARAAAAPEAAGFAGRARSVGRGTVRPDTRPRRGPIVAHSRDLTMTDARPVSLHEISCCFEGIIPAVIATASTDGTPNVTHLTRVHLVDDERVAVSNQFFSKTVRNLAENPQACVLLIDPISYHEYRLILRYERTERR